MAFKWMRLLSCTKKMIKSSTIFIGLIVKDLIIDLNR